MKSSHTDWPYWRRAATGLWTAVGRVLLEVPIPSPFHAGPTPAESYLYRASRARTFSRRRAWRSSPV